AFQLLLHRYTRQHDVAVGSVIANRNRSQIEELIGFFVNTLILRTDLAGDPPFRELLGRVREVALGAYAHQDLPFEKLVEELDPERDLGRQPLFQVMFLLQNFRRAAPELRGIVLSPLEAGEVTAKFDLTLSLSETAGGLAGSLEYSTDLFDAASMRRFLDHYRNLLEDVTAHPGQSLAECSLLSAAERHQLLLEWNDTPTAPAHGALIHELIEAQVARTPEAVAVVGDAPAARKHLSYRELNRRADRLAHELRARGVAPDVLVGLSMEPSPELVVGLLGILKSGGALVPLDPSYPEERLVYMLEDTGISIVLTQDPANAANWVARANDTAGDAYHQTLIPVSRSRNVPQFALVCPSRQDIVEPGAAKAGPGNLAYVIYTSGSTGRPKGVAIPHDAIAGHCRTIRRQLALEPGDRVLQSASFNFDVALEQTFPALLSGCQLVLRGHDLWLPSQLSEKFRELGITVADLPAAYWERWVDESLAAAQSGAPEPLRLVSVGGDVMAPEAACGWSRTPQAAVRLLNAYGPTEATITATAFPVPAVAPERCCRHRVPIGRPFADRSLRILDRRGYPPFVPLRGNPVPIGVPGELCLGGPLLARGYLKRPALTAERFVPDDGGARLYRTGDLARYRPDGNVEFLGRLDDQVKVRGFRIELGEIEAALAAFPGVRETSVVARETGRVPGDRELVAYLGGEPAATVKDLRAFLEQRLPSYMVPAAFVALDALPRLPGGKVDRTALGRRALPEALPGDEGWVPPRNPTEELLVAIWEEVLGYGDGGRARIGVHDDFFDLGGHSLLATQVISRASHALGIEIALRLLFEKPTIAALAVEIEKLSATRRGRPREPLQPVPRTGPLPLSFAQERLWFLDQLDPESTAYNATAALNFQGTLNPEALGRAFDEIVRRHEVLRTTFAVVDDRPVQVVSPPGEHPMPLVDLARLPERDRRAELDARFRHEQARGFDLTRGPLFRSTLLRLAGDDYVLLLSRHHIVFDDWSVGVLVRELATLYRAFAAGAEAPSPLPLEPLPIQYADFAGWQRRQLRGEVLEEHLAFWRARLESPQAIAGLAVDHPRATAGTSRAEGRALTLSAAASNAVRRLSRRQGATLFMTLVATFQTLIYRHTGAPVVVVGAPIAGRSRHEIEGLIGFFVNLQLVRTDFADDPTFRRLLDRVREATLQAYEYLDLPYEKLVEALQPDRSAGAPSLFQALFTFQNAPSQDLELPGVTLRPMELESGRETKNAMFDFSAVMWEW
ncbi:MAG: amino acid adenylation domain-containing protein, partial [bacterium]|nr:amino acid adenylation domain-containing protein [bacterium]